MKKIYSILITIGLFLVTTPVLAVNISNPAPGFFITYADNSFGGILWMVIKLLLSIVGLLSVLFIIYGGFQYITSRGDEEQASAGKKTLTNAIIGLVIVIFSYTIIAIVINAIKPNGKV